MDLRWSNAAAECGKDSRPNALHEKNDNASPTDFRYSVPTHRTHLIEILLSTRLVLSSMDAPFLRTVSLLGFVCWDFVLIHQEQEDLFSPTEYV